MHLTFTTATGDFRIEPPLTYAEFKDSPYWPENERSEPDVLFDVETTEVDGPDGVMLLHRAIAVHPYAPGDPFAYHVGLVETMQGLIDQYGGDRFTGYFECREGDQYAREAGRYTPGDHYRIVIRDGRAVRITPQITWPED